MKQIILASASPRRKELLTQMGLDFKICPASKEEIITAAAPSEAVKELSLQKATEVAAYSEKEAVIIGADTIVAFENKMLGKPKDENDAFRMLKQLQGNTHSVYTGVSIIRNIDNKIITFAEETKVTFYPIEDDILLKYIKTKEPMDKAGAYAIQGSFAVHIKEIQGEYNTVVGLPIARLYHELLNFI